MWDLLNYVNVPDISVTLIDPLCLNLFDLKRKLKHRFFNYFGIKCALWIQTDVLSEAVSEDINSNEPVVTKGHPQ